MARSIVSVIQPVLVSIVSAVCDVLLYIVVVTTREVLLDLLRFVEGVLNPVKDVVWRDNSTSHIKS